MSHYPNALLLALLLGVGMQYASGSYADQTVADSKVPVVDAAGERLYMFVLDEDLAARESAVDEPSARSTMDPVNTTDVFGWHRSNVRALVKRLEIAFGVRAVTMTSHLLPAFSAYVTDATLERMRASVHISEIVPIYKGEISPSYWGNRVEGSETISWGKSAIGTDDALSTSNLVYLIDGGAQPHSDLNLVFATVNPTRDHLYPEHATHVAGILGAAMNGWATRGVNAGATIINVNIGLYLDENAAAMDWVFANLEQRGAYGVANISLNGTPFANGLLSQYVRRLSNRALVVQSAGNYRENACAVAYNATNPNDGILVVGGSDEYGRQTLDFDNAGSGYESEPGSNFGPCVEVWAPSQRIWSSWSNPTEPYRTLSGTSMAAPHVAALAARYGSSTTTPVERENYIRAILQFTGYYDEWNAGIQVPSYTQSPSFVIPTRFPVWGVTADATYPGSSPNYTFDSLYLDTGVWNAGHDAPAWIEYDLGFTRSLKAMRLTPEQSPPGNVTHYIFAGNSPSPTTLVATISGWGQTLEPFVVELTASARYVRVHTDASASWPAWREVEIYGY